MNLVIDGHLTYPPSEVACVRDITLFTAIWTEFTVLVEMSPKYKDHLWRHLKGRGAMDYIEDIVEPLSVHGLRISDEPGSNIKINHITCENLNFIISRLRSFG